MGVTIANFSLSGNIPVLIDWLIITARIIEIFISSDFNNLGDNWSYPLLFFGFNERIIWSISDELVCLSVKLVCMFFFQKI